MELTFDRGVLENINRASEELRKAGLMVQGQFSDEQIAQYMRIMRDLSKDYMNIVGINALHLLETSSAVLSRLQGANAEERAQLQRVCASIDQFVALVKQKQSSK
jgi:hypothetical protein